MLQSRLKLWYHSFHFLHHILYPHIVSFVYHSIGEEWLEGLNNQGRGKNIHPVLEGLGLRQMCISSLNLAKWVKMKSSPFSRSLLISNKNAPSSTYSIQNNWKRFPKLKDFGLWLIIWTVERGESLCLENMALVSPFLSIFSNVSENSMMINRKRTGAMLSPCLTSTLKGMEVSIFLILCLDTRFSYILLIA